MHPSALPVHRCAHAFSDPGCSLHTGTRVGRGQALLPELEAATGPEQALLRWAFGVVWHFWKCVYCFLALQPGGQLVPPLLTPRVLFFWVGVWRLPSVVCLPSILFFISLITEGVEHHSWNMLTTYTSSLLKCLFSLPPILKKRALCFIIKLTGSL